MRLKDLMKAMRIRQRRIKLVISGEGILYDGMVSDIINSFGDAYPNLEGYRYYQVTKIEPDGELLVVTIREQEESTLLSIRDVIRQIPIDADTKIVIIVPNETPSHYFYEPEDVPEWLYDHIVDSVDWIDGVLFIDAHALKEARE